MTIKKIYDSVNFVINKHQGGYLSAEEFNNTFRIAETHHMDFLVGEVRKYQFGRPIPNVGLGMSKKVSESLSPFRKTIPIVIGDNNDIAQSTSIAVTESINLENGKPVSPIGVERLGHRLRSSIIDLEENPIYADYGTYWRVYPANIGNAVATIIENPPFSKYAVTVDEDGRELYDNDNSIDPIWRNGDVVEIIAKMLKIIGVNLKDVELIQYAQSVINQGE